MIVKPKLILFDKMIFIDVEGNIYLQLVLETKKRKEYNFLEKILSQISIC